MIALELGNLEAARNFCSQLRVVIAAENLGAVESLVTHPALMTHVSLPPERRLADGITDGLVRLSIGCEETDDLLTDVDQALDRL